MYTWFKRALALFQNEDSTDDRKVLLCSDCFENEGLRLDAQRLGRPSSKRCPNCGVTGGRKLTQLALWHLANLFFVVGSLKRREFGGAPVVQFNDLRPSDIDGGKRHSRDADLIASKAGIGLFYYGPAMWMLGSVEPLKKLRQKSRQGAVINRVLREYPSVIVEADFKFYRLRKEVFNPEDELEYDSPPFAYLGSGRLDSKGFPILYGSPDVEVCVHECRVTSEDEIYLATLQPLRPLKLLDLTIVLKEDVTPFESLDMAVHMLFQAGSHSYPISREIALRAKSAGFDGLLFPSYFSQLRTGAPFLETVVGISTRRFDDAEAYEQTKVVPNVALFGRPIADGTVKIQSINRLYIRRASYDLGFGPVNP